MLILKYIGSEESYEVEFSSDSEHICTLKGAFPIEETGFTLSRNGRNDNWDYSAYTTIYRTLEDGVQFSNNGSVYEEPEVIVNDYTITFDGGDYLTLGYDSATVEEGTLLSDIEYPEVTAEADGYRFLEWDRTDGAVNADITITALWESIDDVKGAKVAFLNEIQQSIIATGVTVTLSDGSQETFTLTDNDQISLMELQAMAASGATMIPWHNDDHSEGCKYYSLADFMLISNAVIPYVTYHVTYFRDLRRYVMGMETFEDVEGAYYGMPIPEEYQSDVLKSIYAQQAASAEENVDTTEEG